MHRAAKLERFGKGIILIGLLGRILLAVCAQSGGGFLNADSDFYNEGRIACILMVLIGYGLRIWADRQKKKRLILSKMIRKPMEAE